MTDSDIIAAISRIVTYNWADEEKDYNHEALEPGNSRGGHIFSDLMRVQRWLEARHAYNHQDQSIITSTTELFTAVSFAFSHSDEPSYVVGVFTTRARAKDACQQD